MRETLLPAPRPLSPDGTDVVGPPAALMNTTWRRCDPGREIVHAEVALINGDPSWRLPMPGRFMTDPDRTVLYAEVNPD